jgi:hypothetical protein
MHTPAAPGCLFVCLFGRVFFYCAKKDPPCRVSALPGLPALPALPAVPADRALPAVLDPLRQSDAALALAVQRWPWMAPGGFPCGAGTSCWLALTSPPTRDGLFFCVEANWLRQFVEPYSRL